MQNEKSKKLAIFASVLASCTLFYWFINKEQTFPEWYYPHQFKYYDLDAKGEDYSCLISTANSKYFDLQELVMDKTDSWYFDIRSYAPTHTFLSEDMILDFVQGGVVVSYKTEIGLWIQMSKSLTEKHLVEVLFKDICK